MIANHQGSLGYNTGMPDYAKFGYYNWSGAAMGSNPRKVLLRSPTIVADPTGSTYSAEQVRTLLARRGALRGSAHVQNPTAASRCSSSWS